MTCSARSAVARARSPGAAAARIAFRCRCRTTTGLHLSPNELTSELRPHAARLVWGLRIGEWAAAASAAGAKRHTPAPKQTNAAEVILSRCPASLSSPETLLQARA